MILGKKVFDTNCVSCHLPDGGGDVGPNFTDDFWLYGCTKDEIMETIRVGSIINGMTPWEGILSDKEISAVATYIMAFRGTTPDNPKDPQGEECFN